MNLGELRASIESPLRGPDEDNTIDTRVLLALLDVVEAVQQAKNAREGKRAGNYNYAGALELMFNALTILNTVLGGEETPDAE